MRVLIAALSLAALSVGMTWAAVTVTAGAASVEGALIGLDSDPIPPELPRSGEDFRRAVHPIEVEARQSLEILLECDFDGYLMLLDSRGELIAENDDFGDTDRARIRHRFEEGGTHRIIVTTFSPGTTGHYRLSAREIEIPPPSERDGEIGPGQTTVGWLIPGDRVPLGDAVRGGDSFLRDGFRFDGEAGAQVDIELTSEFDGCLFLLGPGDETVAVNDDYVSTRTSRIWTPLEATGVHRIVVTSYASGEQGEYTLSMTLENAP
ncbi:hypothetical protein JXA47_06840 [Candidatus Sumerlaeota bacterium]|nr:hypothetical protein [Candidatus Sumerlaeota bacterium]